MPEGAGKPELHEGICTSCEKNTMVAPCCTTHLIPVCAECYGLSKSVESCRVPDYLREQDSTTYEPLGGVHPSDLLPDLLERVPESDDDQLVEGWTRVDEVVQPEWEVIGIQVTRALMSPDGTVENGEPIGVLELMLGREIHCPGSTAQLFAGMPPEMLESMPIELKAMIGNIRPHGPHVEKMTTQMSVVVPMMMVEAMINAMSAVRDNNFDEHQERWMSEGLEKLLREAEEEGRKGESGGEGDAGPVG